MAIVRQNLQHGQVFAQTLFFGSGKGAQLFHQPPDHRRRALHAKVAQNRQHQSVGLVAGGQGGETHIFYRLASVGNGF